MSIEPWGATGVTTPGVCQGKEGAVVGPRNSHLGRPAVRSCGLQPGTRPTSGDPEGEGAQGRHPNLTLPLPPPPVTKPNQKPEGTSIPMLAAHVSVPGRAGREQGRWTRICGARVPAMGCPPVPGEAVLQTPLPTCHGTGNQELPKGGLCAVCLHP